MSLKKDVDLNKSSVIVHVKNQKISINDLSLEILIQIIY